MWIEYLQSLSNDFQFSHPATDVALVNAESRLDFKLPAELRELLQENNGVEDRKAHLSLYTKHFL
jgi:cell wall assembly regulator SMI1